nr:zinc finger, CCHC-type [Tanacetum cinerariifolium]
MNALFFEIVFPSLTKENESSSRLDDVVVQEKRQRDDDVAHDERQHQYEEEDLETRKCKKARIEKSFRPDFVSFMELVDLPLGCKPLCYRWIFKKNMKANGTIDKYKARLVIKDDMLIVGRNDNMIQSTKGMLRSRFDMKDMGLAHVILGVKITRNQNGLMLNQTHFVDTNLEKYNPDDSNIVRSPIYTTTHLSKDRGQGVNQTGYSSIIGSLMYLMNCTRPDLAYVVTRLSRYLTAIEGYNDSKWISDIKDSRSTSGYVFTLELQLYHGNLPSRRLFPDPQWSWNLSS